MDSFKLKRVTAYLIDLLIVSLLLTLLGQINFLDPYRNEYNKAYEEYQEYVNKLNNNTTADNEVITDNETNNTVVENTTENTIVENKTLTTEDILSDEYADITYRLSYYSIYATILNVIVLLLYFTLFPLFFKGQTIGKKLLGLQIKDINNKKIKWYQYLIRALFIPLFSSIILYTPLTAIINIPIVFIFNGITYVYVNLAITIIFCIFAYADALIGISNKENLSLHDRIAHTKIDYYEKDN